MILREYPIAIIGAGPVGLAAAAQLTQREIPFILFEAGNSVGANLLDWGHVKVFSPWQYNIDKAARQLLEDIGWTSPDANGLPTGRDLVNKYLLPLSLHPKLDPNIFLSSKVIHVTKKGLDKVKNSGREKTPFIVTVDRNGVVSSYKASGIIDASGTWQNPNPIGTGGIFAVGEKEHASQITYRIPDISGEDKMRHVNASVMVVGSGHSAINSLLDLAKLKEEYPKTTLHWAIRVENLSTLYGGKEDDSLQARGELGIKIEQLVNSGQLEIHSPFHIHKISDENGKMKITGFLNDSMHTVSQVDEIIANTGSRPEFSLINEVRFQSDPALECVPDLAELIDPNLHSCGTVRPHGEIELRQPEPNFYIVGTKSYGRAPTFLMATGYEQVRSIAAWLDGDEEAARRVELDLPETGVCSSDTANGAVCCGTAPVNKETNDSKTEACCSSDINENLNDKTMKKEEKVIQKQVAETGCCGGTPSNNEDACCKLDEEKKAEGEEGCGCNTESISSATSKSCC